MTRNNSSTSDLFLTEINDKIAKDIKRAESSINNL